MHLTLYMIYGPNDIQNMNIEVGTYRERLDLTAMNKTCLKMDATSSTLGTICGTEGSKDILGLSAKVARKAVRGWTNRKHEEY